MKKIILGALVGAVAWGCLLSISDFIWIKVSPDWYGVYQNDLQAAIYQNKPFYPPTSTLLIVVLRSIIFSIISGFTTATVAYENNISTLISGILLILCGFIVHLSFWNLVPYWFHLLIFLQFIPFTMLGGRLITIVPNYQKLVFDSNLTRKPF